jgi:hypothetical protein
MRKCSAPPRLALAVHEVQQRRVLELPRRVRGTKVTLISPVPAIFVICAQQIIHVEEVPPELRCLDSKVPLRKRTNSRSDGGRIEGVTFSHGAGSSGRTTPSKVNPAEVLCRDGNSSVVAWASGGSARRGATPAPLPKSANDPLSRPNPLLSALAASIGLPPSESCLHRDSFRRIRSKRPAAGM